MAAQIGVAKESKDGLMPASLALSYGSLERTKPFDCNCAFNLGQKMRGLYWSNCPTGFETCYGMLEVFGYQDENWVFQIISGISTADASFLGRYIRHSKGSSSSWSEWISLL